MNIINEFTAMDVKPVKNVFPEKGPVSVAIAAEHRMRMEINGRPPMDVVCSPEHLEELAAGRMLTEGIVDSAAEIEELRIDLTGSIARVQLQQMDGKKETAMRPVQPILRDPDWWKDVLEEMKKGAPLYRETHALHACYLIREGHILCCREDLGRHNALDKAIGWAMIQGAALHQCILFITGRMPSDMVSKAIRAGIPVLVSKTFPTDRGLELARSAGLTLITVRSGQEPIIWYDGFRGKLTEKE